MTAASREVWEKRKEVPRSGPSGESKRGRENDGGMVLGLNGVLMTLLVSIVSVASEDDTVETELAYSS